MNTEAEFIQQTADRFKEAFERVFLAIGQLNEQQLWTRPSSESNSVGIILQHLTGNLNQWICAGLGGMDFQRNRPEEFIDVRQSSKEEIIAQFKELAERVLAIISHIQPDSLHASRNIQGLDVTVMKALYKGITHFEFHEGQILYIAKMLLNEQYTTIWTPKPMP
jgi:uncharacterized damage-inducible protein DinB